MVENANERLAARRRPSRPDVEAVGSRFDWDGRREGEALRSGDCPGRLASRRGGVAAQCGVAQAGCRLNRHHVLRL